MFLASVLSKTEYIFLNDESEGHAEAHADVIDQSIRLLRSRRDFIICLAMVRSSYPIMDELLDTFWGYIKALGFRIQRKRSRESMARTDPQNSAPRWGVVVLTTTPRRSSSSGKWWNPVMFWKPYSSFLRWIVHLETPNNSPILIQLNPNSRNSSNISPGMSNRDLPGVSFSSSPGPGSWKAD